MSLYAVILACRLFYTGYFLVSIYDMSLYAVILACRLFYTGYFLVSIYDMSLYAVILACRFTPCVLVCQHSLFSCIHVCTPSLTTICECICSNIVK